MKKLSKRKFAVLGLVAACAGVLVIARQPSAQSPTTGAQQNPLTANSNTSGRLPSLASLPVAYAAPTPRNSAQAKLGAGQLLQAVQLLSQSQNAPAPTSQGSAPTRTARGKTSNASIATQIAALDAAGIPLSFRDGEKVKININLGLPFEELQNPSLLDRATSTLRETLLSAGLEAQKINGSPSLEAKVPLARLEWVAGLASVAQVSLMAMPQTVAFTDGAGASNLDKLRSLGNYNQLAAGLRRDLKGEGLTIAVFDQFADTAGEIKKLQDANEWPKNTTSVTDKVTLFKPTAGAFGYTAQKHGNAVVEIVYDLAPEAKYRIYDAGQTGDWVKGIQDAANLNALNEPQGEPRAQVITASQGTTLLAPGDGTSTGSSNLKGLYDALEAAVRNGVLVFNAAGNEADGKYWDGDATAGAGVNVVQDFDAGNRDANGQPILDSINRVRNTQFADCVPVGSTVRANDGFAQIVVRLSWNDWTSADNTTNADYKLELMYWGDEVRNWLGQVTQAAGWRVLNTADTAQTGQPGQEPTEFVGVQLPGAAKTSQCNGVFNWAGAGFAGGGKFGVRVTRKTAGVSNFLRLSASGYNGKLGYSQSARSLVHPADLASVVTVAALDAATSNLEAYSSRGPILAAGGARPAGQAEGNAKPDLANFANVDTVSYGDNAFNGTSSATPHAAALALLGLQHQRQLTNATVPAPLPANATAQQKTDRTALLKQRNVNLSDSTYDSLIYVASTGGNDLGDVGLDASYGHGRLKFHDQAEACFLAATYDAKYRSLLPAQPSPLPEGQKSYDQLQTENNTLCAAVAAGNAIAPTEVK